MISPSNYAVGTGGVWFLVFGLGHSWRRALITPEHRAAPSLSCSLYPAADERENGARPGRRARKGDTSGVPGRREKTTSKRAPCQESARIRLRNSRQSVDAGPLGCRRARAGRVVYYLRRDLSTFPRTRPRFHNASRVGRATLSKAASVSLSVSQYARHFTSRSSSKYFRSRSARVTQLGRTGAHKRSDDRASARRCSGGLRGTTAL